MVNINTKPYSTTKLDRPFTADELARREEWLHECTCRPQDALLCPSCLERKREKYGDSIPFFVDGKEVIDD